MRCDKGWSHLDSFWSESSAKIVRLHIDIFGKYDAALISPATPKKAQNYACKSSEVVRQNNFDLYETIRNWNVSMLAYQQWFVSEVVIVTVLFWKFCRSIVTTSSNTGPSPRVAGNSSSLQRSGPSLPREPRTDLICRQHWKLAWRIANLPEHRGVRRILAWNHLCDADLLEGGRTLKSKRFVNTKADGHGWERRNLTNNGLDDFIEFL